MITLDKFAKTKEHKSKGFNKSQTSRNLALDYKTIDKYWNMTNEKYIGYVENRKSRSKKVDKYRFFVNYWG